MAETPTPDAEPLLSSSEIARLAGVTRAAVTNWRKRYPDFPKPVSGTSGSARFSRAEVAAWLESQQRGAQVSDETRLWEALRGRYGDDMLRAVAALAQQLAEFEAAPYGTDKATTALIQRMVDSSSATDVVDSLVAMLIASSARSGGEQYSPVRLAEAVAWYAGRIDGTVLDPACGLGTLLLALDADEGSRFFVQDREKNAVVLTIARLRLQGRSLKKLKSQVGDSLRDPDRSDPDNTWPYRLKADLVVCEVPAGEYEWGREELLLDRRWEFGVPPRAEGELAWLQHCYAHTAEGGRTIVVLPASVAYRRSGRRIRAEIVRRGALVEVVALPGGIAAAHSQPVHLWVLRRSENQQDSALSIRMTDLTANGIDGPYVPAPEQTVEVPVIDLLGEEVDLTPGTYVAAAHTDYVGRYAQLRDEIEQRLRVLAGLLPELEAGSGLLNGPTVSIADLSSAGLVNVVNGEVISTAPQLDRDCVNGFLRSAANARRSSGSSTTHRADLRGTRIPKIDAGDQQRLGSAFHALDEFEALLGRVAELGREAAGLGRDGLAGGALAPSEDSDATG